MDVPRRMRLVLTAAAAKIVNPSGRAPPVVSQAAETPNSSARSIMGDGVGGGAGDGKADSFFNSHCLCVLLEAYNSHHPLFVTLHHYRRNCTSPSNIHQPCHNASATSTMSWRYMQHPPEVQLRQTCRSNNIDYLCKYMIGLFPLSQANGWQKFQHCLVVGRGAILQARR